MNIISFIKKRDILILSLCFFLFRTLFLTRLPIFNDEAIYLDWGWKELSVPGALFYSLMDGKQPFLMWIFGISQMLFSDQLFAGRIVSVLAGFITLLGIYRIAKYIFTQEVAFLASCFYITIPIFSAYDRMALMESSISAVGVWSVYFLLHLLKSKNHKYAYYLGGVLGIGFFIKSSALLFLLTSLLILFYQGWKNKDITTAIKHTGIILGCGILIAFLLLLQPLYWQTITMNARYTLTFTELIHFPIIHFIKNTFSNLAILIVFVTPVIAILGFIKAGKLILYKHEGILLSIWFFLTLFSQTLFVRNTTQRYLVSFLPLVVIFAAAMLVDLKSKLKSWYYVVLVISLLIPLLFTTVQLYNPIHYIQLAEPLTNQADSAYIYGQTSGYGIQEIVGKIKNYTHDSPYFLATAINIGNPESAIPVYFHKSQNIVTGYLDMKMFGSQLSEYQCIKSTIPILFISRDEQQAELNDYFEEVARVYHPLGGYSLGLYTLKQQCAGKTVTINPIQ